VILGTAYTESRFVLATDTEKGGHAVNTHVEDLIAYPQRYFDRPDEVLVEPMLTLDEKHRILESWKLDAQRLAESTAENMSGRRRRRCPDIPLRIVAHTGYYRRQSTGELAHSVCPSRVWRR